MAESEEELKSILMKVKEESEKVSLKFNVQKTKIMACGHISSQEIGKQWKQCQTLFFFFFGSKITADGDCSHEIKRRLLLGKNINDQPRLHIKKQTLLCQQMSMWSKLWFFQWSCMDVRVGLWRKLSTKELMLLNYAVGEDSWESLGLQGVPTSPS